LVFRASVYACVQGLVLLNRALNSDEQLGPSNKNTLMQAIT